MQWEETFREDESVKIEEGRFRVVLGSSSPRRRELLQLLLGSQQMWIEPPADSREEELTGALTQCQIEQGMLKISRTKANQVSRQLKDKQQAYDFLLTADTSVVVPCGQGQFQVLAKPDPARYPQQVRHWFDEYYLGKEHQVLTAVCLFTSSGMGFSRVVSTRVRFQSASRERIDWYLATGESLGKAGGYAVQGLGSALIEHIDGSLSNVMGLPLLETQELLEQAAHGMP